MHSSGFPGGSDGKESACNAGDLGSIPELGRSPGGRHGNPLQYSCLENPMDRGDWWAIVYRVKESDMTEWLTLHFFTVPFSSVAQSCPILCDPMDCSTRVFPVHHQLLELTQTQVHCLGDAIQPLHPLPSVFLSIRVFSNVSVLCIRWPKYWSFSFASVIPMNNQD